MRKTILVVDDDRVNLVMAEKLLQDEYNVISVISGHQALRFLEKRKPDLVLLDIKMPEMNGFEVMQSMSVNELWNKIPVIFLTADKDTSTEVECLKLGAVDFVGKPFEPEIMKNRIKRTLEIEEYRKDLEGAVRKQTIKIETMQQEIINSLANLIESRDGSTGEHVKRTSFYVEIIVNSLHQLGMYSDIITNYYIYNLIKAAPMHDIGKIKVPDQILQKPVKLTTDEFDVMKIHAAVGGEIIQMIMGEIEEREYVEIASDVASYHHEKWNGTGYPKGLKGEQIPLAARIMSVADVFDALVSKRCYKDPMSLPKAFQIIEESKGEHFDPQIAQVFLNLRSEIEAYLENNV